MDTDLVVRTIRRRTFENYQSVCAPVRQRGGPPVTRHVSTSLLLAVGVGRLIKTLHRFSGEQFFAHLEVIALPDLPGRKQSGDLGRGQPLHEDFDRFGGGRGFVWDCHTHILCQAGGERYRTLNNHLA